MGIVNQILLVVQSAAIPLLAVIMALIVFNLSLIHISEPTRP